jgi:hypothetical protein
MKFAPVTQASDGSMAEMKNLLHTYFGMGGMDVQYHIVTSSPLSNPGFQRENGKGKPRSGSQLSQSTGYFICLLRGFAFMVDWGACPEYDDRAKIPKVFRV